MKLSIKAGATSQSINIFIQDSSSTTGAGLTGLAYNTAGLTAYYSFAGASATATAITLATLATVTTAYSSGGFIAIDGTNMPGWYRLDLPNAAIASGNGRSVALHLKGATNMAPLPIEIELTGWDNQDGVRAGLTALPNVAAGANGGLPTGDASGHVTFANTSIATVTNLTNLPSIPANWLTATGINAGALNGKGDWNVGKTGYSISGTLTTLDALATHGDIAWATATSVTVSDKTGFSLSAAGLASVTAWTVNITGNISGSVGSVTGNIGGNVVGSVASVTNPVAVTSNIKQNTGSQNLSFTMTDSTNHNPAPGLTVSASRSIDGGAFSACTNSVVEIASGDYNIILSAADTNGKTIMYRFTATGADDLNLLIITQP